MASAPPQPSLHNTLDQLAVQMEQSIQRDRRTRFLRQKREAVADDVNALANRLMSQHLTPRARPLSPLKIIGKKRLRSGSRSSTSSYRGRPLLRMGSSYRPKRVKLLKKTVLFRHRAKSASRLRYVQAANDIQLLDMSTTQPEQANRKSMRRLEAEISKTSRASIRQGGIDPPAKNKEELLRQDLRKRELNLRYDLDEGIVGHADVKASFLALKDRYEDAALQGWTSIEGFSM